MRDDANELDLWDEEREIIAALPPSAGDAAIEFLRLFDAVMPANAMLRRVAMQHYTHHAAMQRIADTPELQPYAELLLADWDEGAHHYAWVCTAPVAELIDWAQEVEAGIAEARQALRIWGEEGKQD